MSLVHTTQARAKVTTTAAQAGETTTRKSTGELSSRKASPELAPDASSKDMGPGLAPGSQWKIGILGQSNPGQSSESNTTPPASPLSNEQLRKMGLWPQPCPLCRRTNTVTLVAVDAGAARNTTDYVFECSYPGCSKSNRFTVNQYNER